MAFPMVSVMVATARYADSDMCCALEVATDASKQKAREKRFPEHHPFRSPSRTLYIITVAIGMAIGINMRLSL